MNRLMAWYITPRTKRFYQVLMSLGLILGIGMRWLHYDFLSGLGFGLVIGVFIMYGISVFRNSGARPAG